MRRMALHRDDYSSDSRNERARASLTTPTNNSCKPHREPYSSHTTGTKTTTEFHALNRTRSATAHASNTHTYTCTPRERRAQSRTSSRGWRIHNHPQQHTYSTTKHAHEHPTRPASPRLLFCVFPCWLLTIPKSHHETVEIVVSSRKLSDLVSV